MTTTLTKPETVTRVAAAPLDWQRRARCHGAPRALFITEGDADDEPTYPPPEAQRYCGLCPVRTECLAYALEHDMVGVWGGTTAFQRQQMKRKLNRSACLGCGATDSLVTEDLLQLCLSCGVSWHVF